MRPECIFSDCTPSISPPAPRNLVDPVEILATYPGTGSNSSNGNVIFDPGHYFERAGLALSNGIVYTTWTSHGDCPPYTSWVIGYDEHTLAQVRVLNLTHNGRQGAIWQSGGAPAVDSRGFLYAMLGNGTFDTTLDANGFPSQAQLRKLLREIVNGQRSKHS